MKALFIGGTGLISTAVSKLAIERGWDLTLFNRGQHIHGIPEGANIVTVDINDDEAVRRAMEGKHYDVIAQWIAFKPERVARDIDLFLGNLSALVEELYSPESPAFNAHALFETLCERGKGYNIFLYAEAADKDQANLMAYGCFESMCSYRSGIRFGGRFGDQQVFSFENVSYLEQDRSMKCGLGMIPSENREDRQIKVVVPMS